MPDFQTGSTDPRQLNEGGDINLKPRSFSWDAVILYLGSSILALTAFDALSEYIRGKGVSCINADGQDSGAYISNYCSGSLPRAQYFPAFLYLHALAIVIPHFMFNASFREQFDYFFSVARNLKADEGKLSKKNIAIVHRLTASFTIYKQNSIYLCYLGKLFIQLLCAGATLYLSIWYFTDFDVNFQCPQNTNQLNTTNYPPTKPAICVYNSLRLLYYLRIVDISLVAIICCAVLKGFWFCASSHPFILQPKKVAMFSYKSGIDPNMYSIDCGKCCPTKCCCNVISPRYLPRLFFPPMISTNFDFLLLKLACTNPGLGKLFRDIQIELEIRNVTDEEKMAIASHCFNCKENCSALEIPWPDSDDINWHFTSKSPPWKPPHDASHSLSRLLVKVPNTIRGTVLGLSGYAPTVDGALVIEFNKSGLALSLQRRFTKVSSIVFCNAREMEADIAIDSCKDSDKKLDDLIQFVQDAEYFTEVVVSGNVMVATGTSSIQVLKRLEPLLKKDEQNPITSFVVIGPMNKRQAHLMNYFLTHLTSNNFLTENCLIITLVPRRIGWQLTTREDFQGFSNKCPYKCHKLDLNLNVVADKYRLPLTWPPNSERQSESAANTTFSASLNLEEISTEDQPLLSTADSSVIEGADDYEFDLQCGETNVGFEIQAYRFRHQ